MNGEVSRPEERSAIILLIIISIVRPFVPGSFVWGLVIVQLVLLVRAIPRHDWNTVHLGILLCSLTLFSVLPGTRRWPWIFLMPVLLYWALVQSFRPLRLTTAWLRVGHPTLPMWIAAATVAVGSAVSLLLWFKLARPDVTWQAGLIPTWSPGRLVLLGLGFALFNAAVEEMIWRGVVFHALERTGLPTFQVVLMQAVSFGVVHLHGFPSGSLGILLASAYGAILGVLRWQTRGLLVPFVAHAVTDLSIFEILIYLAHD
ncbi:MAG: CPBP family intramembrane metalloprotease [Verrucomicrobia bacterium]|nr:MAG: CPBP family intramembrane metalloprotease [Verrucomicrobiota bacterium]